MKISVIIPTYNSENTIRETLDSVRNQTCQNWESIVVDDGSSDSTCSIIEQYADMDSRISIYKQDHRGVSIARNHGIDKSSSDWLLFLDSDDLLTPNCLETFGKRISSDSQIDALHCGWSRITEESEIAFRERCSKSGKIFPEFARGNVFATVSACMIRKSIIESSEGFDHDYPTCQDWDIWQRVSRTGINFIGLPQTLVHYRMRKGSVSSDIVQTIKEAIELIEIGHSSDARVKNPDKLFKSGMPRNQIPDAISHWICWPAGQQIARNEDFNIIFELIKDYGDTRLEARCVAELIYKSILVALSITPSDWTDCWTNFGSEITKFLSGLEEHSKTPGLVKDTEVILSNILQQDKSKILLVSSNKTYSTSIQLTEPIRDIDVSRSFDRLNLYMELEHEYMGNLELPVFDGLVPGYVLSDAIAYKYAWEILGNFFNKQLYDKLQTEINGDFLCVYRNGTKLTKITRNQDEKEIWNDLFNKAGWTLFLQEVWGLPDRDASEFYLGDDKIGSMLQINKPDSNVRTDITEIEISKDIAELDISNGDSILLVKVGGIPIDAFEVSLLGGEVNSETVIGVINSLYAKEIFRVSVREALVGKPISDKKSLRERLLESSVFYEQDKNGDNLSLTNEDYIRKCTQNILLNSIPNHHDNTGIIGRRAVNLIGTSISRRFALPVNEQKIIAESAVRCGEIVSVSQAKENEVKSLIYSPELFSLNSRIENSSHKIHQYHKSSSLIEPLIYKLSASPPIKYISRIINSKSNKIPDRSSEHLNSENEVISDYSHSTHKLPILCYKMNKSDNSLDSLLIKLKEQLKYLHENKYYTVTLEDWHRYKETETPLPGRALIIALCSDDYKFLEKMCTLLEQFNYKAIIFLELTDSKDRVDLQDPYFKIVKRLIDRGFKFGVKFKTDQHMYDKASQVVSLLSGLRINFVKHIKLVPTAIYYDFMLTDEIFTHLLGACGYVYGISSRFNYCSYYDSLLEMPSIGINLSDDLETFKSKLIF